MDDITLKVLSSFEQTERRLRGLGRYHILYIFCELLIITHLLTVIIIIIITVSDNRK